MTSLLILLLGGTIITCGDIIMKYWVTTSKTNYFLIGILVYTIGLVCLGITFKEKNIAVASIIFELFNLVTLIAVSYLMFSEKLSTTQIMGVILAIIAVILLEIG